MAQSTESRSQDSQDDTDRLFIALRVPEPVRESLLQLPQQLPGVSWTRPDQLHVTLRFLGDVPKSRIDPLLAQLDHVRVVRFLLQLEGVGAFPPNRPPKVIWVGITAAHPRLFQLRQRIDDRLLAAGIETDLRRFHPHVTMGRCSGNAAGSVTHWLHANRKYAAPPFRVESFDLYSSDLRPNGPVHTLVQRFALPAQ